MKRYCVWGVDKSYRYLWQASLVAGWVAFKSRWSQGNRMAASEAAKQAGLYSLAEPVRTMSGELSPNTERKPSDSEILELASREDAYPCNPFWLKDEVPVGDVQAAAVKFARAVIDRFGRKES